MIERAYIHHWCGAHAGVEHAQFMVVNAGPGGNRGAAEGLVADVVRLRKDKELAADAFCDGGAARHTRRRVCIVRRLVQLR